jgi:hypothetical protein
MSLLTLPTCQDEPVQMLTSTLLSRLIPVHVFVLIIALSLLSRLQLSLAAPRPAGGRDRDPGT